MKRNSQSAFLRRIILAEYSAIGGQAVMEGVMMRNGDTYGLAVRRDNGDICAQRLPWRSFTGNKWLGKPFVRGFPILLETMINGVHGLNRSVLLGGHATGENSVHGSWGMAFSLALALLFAVGLFVVAPHLLSLLMLALGLSGDVEGLSFHLWDGLFKCAIFIAYIRMIAMLPDIQRVFEYHGAEHKTIHAYERDLIVTSATAHGMSRLHPRCGTTFLLFVICISIVFQALLVPLMLKVWSPDGTVVKHASSIVFKLFLIIPISAAAYELIRLAGRMSGGVFARILQMPGLALQKLTTAEPDRGQLEVAVVALAEALGPDSGGNIRTVPYLRMPPDKDSGDLQ